MSALNQGGLDALQREAGEGGEPREGVPGAEDADDGQDRFRDAGVDPEPHENRDDQHEKRLECDSPEGRLICDEIVEDGAMDAALARVVGGLTTSGVVSAASNRRAFRITQEPLDMFREYFAVYAREQAYCHFSPALIGNLERYWNAQNRKL